MEISIVKASATGPTALAAFDAALQKAGIADNNLIYLSSIIPPGSQIVKTKPVFTDKQFGNKLFVVMAQTRVIERHKQAWAGVGWVQDKKTKKGLFVEHHGYSDDQVQQDINNTLKWMVKNRPGNDWGAIHMAVEEIICGDELVCALMAAVYQSVSWDCYF